MHVCMYHEYTTVQYKYWYVCVYVYVQSESFKQEIENMKQFVNEAESSQEEALASASEISAQFEDLNNQKALWMVLFNAT